MTKTNTKQWIGDDVTLATFWQPEAQPHTSSLAHHIKPEFVSSDFSAPVLGLVSRRKEGENLFPSISDDSSAIFVSLQDKQRVYILFWVYHHLI